MRWQTGLADLRQICLATGMTETVKWGHPCYMHAGRNIAIIGAFRGDFRLSFFNASLMTDPEGCLEKQGANTRHADMFRFTDTSTVDARKEIIMAYLKEAMGYADAGLKPEPSQTEIGLPDELMEALDADPILAEAFHALTPGRQKGYAIVIGGAKQSATRARRVEKYRDKIMAGKGPNDFDKAG